MPGVARWGGKNHTGVMEQELDPTLTYPSWGQRKGKKRQRISRNSLMDAAEAHLPGLLPCICQRCAPTGTCCGGLPEECAPSVRCVGECIQPGPARQAAGRLHEGCFGSPDDRLKWSELDYGAASDRGFRDASILQRPVHC